MHTAANAGTVKGDGRGAVAVCLDEEAAPFCAVSTLRPHPRIRLLLELRSVEQLRQAMPKFSAPEDSPDDA